MEVVHNHRGIGRLCVGDEDLCQKVVENIEKAIRTRVLESQNVHPERTAQPGFSEHAEGRSLVAHTRELDLSSCGGTKKRALQNLKEAARLFLEEAEEMGTLGQILEEAGYLKRKRKRQGPKFITTKRIPLPLPLEDVKAIRPSRKSSRPTAFGALGSLA